MDAWSNLLQLCSHYDPSSRPSHSHAHRSDNLAESRANKLLSAKEVCSLHPTPSPKSLILLYQELLERLDARCKACASQLDGLKRSIAMIDDEERVSLMLVRARIKPSAPWSTRACV